MGRESLHWFRLITPGVLAALAFATFVLPVFSFDKVAELADRYQVLSIVALLFVGVPYRIFNARSVLLARFWRDVNLNIEDRLSEIIQARMQLTPAELDALRRDRGLMNLFYKIVDHDESLKARAEGVYFNGFLLTLAADVTLVWGTFSAAHLLVWAASLAEKPAFWGLLLGMISVLSAVFLLPATVRRHKALSNEQLNLIRMFHADDVLTLAKTLLQNVSGRE